MKIKYILFLIFATLLLFSCEDKVIDPVLNLGAPPQLTTPTAGTNFTLLETEIDDLITAFTWTAADFGYPAGITYAVEMAAAGTNFEDLITLSNVAALEYDELTVGRLNNILLAKGFPFNFANPLEVRVCASVGSTVDQLCSNVVGIEVVPYPAEVIYPVLGVPGQYQDWNEKDMSTVVYSRNSDEVYSGYIYFDVDNSPYKFNQGFTWDINWGDDEADGILNLGGFGNDIILPGTAGMYYLMADLNSLEHSATRTDWGVLGSATAGGTTTDTDFEWEAPAGEDKGILTVTLDLSVGTIRFRANDANDTNFGDDFNNGTLEVDGEDIPIEEAGNYTIRLELDIGDPVYTITKN